jgi:hypothetical protein
MAKKSADFETSADMYVSLRKLVQNHGCNRSVFATKRRGIFLAQQQKKNRLIFSPFDSG